MRRFYKFKSKLAPTLALLTVLILSCSMSTGCSSQTSSNGRVHETAAATSSTGQTENTKPLAASARLSKQLRACEARLIYEAKEYDILATHYNALLAIYKRAQEVSNGNGKEDGDRKGHG